MKENITKPVRNILSGVIGNTLEWYDFALFGAFASTFSKLFFPADNLYTGMLKTYGIFAAGFIMRPLGSFILGYIGDKHGRKQTLILSMILMALPTLCIGFLPTYAQIGSYAPLILIVIRLLQGFSMGGEYSISMVFLTEHAPDHRRAFFSSWADFGCLLGVLMGSLAAWGTVTFLSPDDYLGWGWRLPFFGSLVLTGLVFYFRRSLEETSSFLEPPVQVVHQPTHASRFFLMNIVPAVLIYAFGNVCFYIFLVYLPNYFIQVKLTTQSASLVATSMISALIALFIPIGGYLSDRYGRKKLFNISIFATALLAYPLFLTASAPYLFYHHLIQIIFALVLAMFYGGEAAFFAESFPASIRCRAVSLTLSFSNILFGGLSPLVATFLVEKYDDIKLPGLLILFLAFFALWGLWKIPDRASYPLPANTDDKPHSQPHLKIWKEFANSANRR